MTRKFLEDMGLDKEKIDRILDENSSDIGKAKGNFDNLSAELQSFKTQLAERDKQLEKLKDSSADNQELKNQIAELQKQNADQKKAHDAELNQLKLDNAIDTALTAAGAKNIKAVKPFIDVAKIKLGNDGKLTGLDEQLKEVQKNESYLFAEKQPQFKGFQPGASMDEVPCANTMTLEQLRKLTPNQRHAFSTEHPEEYKKIYEGGI